MYPSSRPDRSRKGRTLFLEAVILTLSEVEWGGPFLEAVILNEVKDPCISFLFFSVSGKEKPI